jgi:hypothetical protein
MPPSARFVVPKIGYAQRLAPACATIRAQRSCVLVFSPSSCPAGAPGAKINPP